MILDVLELTLTPLIVPMDLVFGLFRSLIRSAGWSIVLLALLMTVLAHPVRAWAQAVETRVRLRMQTVDADIAATTVGMKGEKKFRAIEKIYKAHSYHPIHSVALGTPLFIMLPILLSALFLFGSNSTLDGVAFLAVRDLSLPDGLAWGVNLLPVIMTGITLVDSAIRYRDDRNALIRFLIIALVMFVLVYGFASAIVVFWITCNLVSMISYLVRHPRAALF